MIRVIIGTTAVFALVSSTGIASGGATHLQQSTRVEVTPAGAFYRTADRLSEARPNDGPTIAQTSGLIWTKTDGGLGWQANAVAMANFGSEVFTEYDVFNQQDQLFSAFDSNPPTAIWTDPTSANTTRCRHVAAANTAGIYVSIHANSAGTATIVSKYSTTGTPDWTYTFPFGPPPSLDGGTGIGISRNGQTIVATTSNVPAGTADIAVFSPASNVPLSYTTVNLGSTNNDIRGFDLSADGSTLYYAPGGSPTANIFDVASATVVFSTSIGASFESHAISGDGSVFAFGNFNTMKVWEKIAGVYTNTFTRTIAGSNYCDKIDISDDSKTIAYGYTFYDNYLTVRIEALDVPTHTVTMTDIVTTTGSLQDVVSGISCSADGQRFAVGLWGDGSGPVAEARLYKKNQNLPIGTVNLNGSVWSVSISADGQRMVAGSKAVHANTFGGGGEVDLFGDSTPFNNYCFNSNAAPIACPCGNSGTTGRGCNNSASTGGALLTAGGAVSPDTVVLTSSHELPSVLSIVLQGQSAISGVPFGDGVRCVGGILKRLYSKNASGGTVSAPGVGDPSITARSAALGDPIMPGTPRYYQTYYRDPVLTFCAAPTGDAWNVSNAVQVNW